MKKLVKEVFDEILKLHVKKDHGLIGSADIEKNLIKKDYSNLLTPMRNGKYSLSIMDSNGIKMDSNGIMECSIKYSFESKANQKDFWIDDRKYYHQKSPIWDESDQTIFA